ncbi:MAG: HAD family hydrolase [Pontibacterium sp.]
MRLDAILFDHDGTLVSSEQEHLKHWREAAEKYGGTISDEFYWENMLGVDALTSAKLLIDLNGFDIIPEAFKQERLEHSMKFFQQSHFPQMEGADYILEKFASEMPLALVSAAQRICLQSTIRGHKWQDHFKCVVSYDDVINTKPAPECYLTALDQLGVEAQYCVAIEDTETGLTAATAAGIPTIAIRSEYSMSHDFSKAITVVNSLREAADWLDAVRAHS